MAYILTNWPKFQAFDGTGTPLAGGKLYTYTAGTLTDKDTFNAKNGSTNTNPIILDARGEADVWLEAGSYKFVLKDSDDNTIWTVDNIDSQLSEISVYTTKTSLTAATANDNDLAVVIGRSSDNDHGGGLFFYDSSSSAADDGGIIWKPDSNPANGRWTRLFQDRINLKWFGATGDGTTDDSSAIQLAIDYINTSGQEYDLLAENGTFRLSSSITLPSDINLRFSGDAKFSVDSGATLTVNCAIDENCNNIFTGDGNFVIGVASNPYIWANWFGATGDGSTDDQATIQKALTTANAGTREHVVKLKPGTYKIGSSLTLGTSASDGIVLEGSGTNSTIITHDVDSDNAIEWPSSGSNCRLRNIKLSSSGANSNTAINLGGGSSNNCFVENVIISGFQDAIAFSLANQVYMNNVVIVDCVNSGLTLGTNSNVYFTGKIDGNSTASSIGVTIAGGKNININANLSNWDYAFDIGDNSVVNFDGQIASCVTGAVKFTGNCSLSGNNIHISSPGSSSCFEFSGTSKTAHVNYGTMFISDSVGTVPWILKQSGTTCECFITVGSLKSDNSVYEWGGAQITNMTSLSTIKELNTPSIHCLRNSGDTFGVETFSGVNSKTISTPAIEADSIVFIQVQDVDARAWVSAISAGTSFDIDTNTSITSDIAWHIVKP